jgi:hypothetical protein
MLTRADLESRLRDRGVTHRIVRDSTTRRMYFRGERLNNDGEWRLYAFKPSEEDAFLTLCRVCGVMSIQEYRATKRAWEIEWNAAYTERESGCASSRRDGDVLQIAAGTGA